MKKLFLLIAILFLFVNINSQTPLKKQFLVGAQCKSVISELSALHKQTNSFFEEKNYEQAYLLAKKMSEIAEANCIEEKDKRLTMALNVAEIQIKRGKMNEAREIYDRNLTIAEEAHGTGSLDFNNYLNFLIKISINEVSNEKFEQYALKSVEAKKAFFGVESYEAANEITKMALFYRKLKEFEKAEPFYLEAISISDSMPSNVKVQKLAVVNQYRVYLLDRFGDKEGGKKADEFMRSRSNEVYTTNDNRRVLNGRATKLFTPKRSSQAFVIDAKGKVEVEITIGEDGKVFKAKAISGHPLLHPSAEQAAMLSTFLPTYIEGKPIRVTGVIVYNFY